MKDSEAEERGGWTDALPFIEAIVMAAFIFSCRIFRALTVSFFGSFADLLQKALNNPCEVKASPN